MDEQRWTLGTKPCAVGCAAPDVASVVSHCFARKMSPEQTVELLGGGDALLSEVKRCYEHLATLTSRWNEELAGHFAVSDSIGTPSMTADEYEIGVDEAIQALWAVAASNEGLGAFSGTLVLSIIGSGPPPGEVEFEGRFRTFARVGANTRKRSDRSKGHFGFPNFHQADYGDGVVFGCMLVPNGAWLHRDVPASRLGNMSDPIWKIWSVNRYADFEGFGAALPTYHQRGQGPDLHFGVVLFASDVVTTRVVPRSRLGNPTDAQARFRAANDYAVDSGFSAAFPTYIQDTRDSISLACFRTGIASHIDVNYSVGAVLGGGFDYSGQIEIVPYGSLHLPGLDAGSPRLRIPVPK